MNFTKIYITILIILFSFPAFAQKHHKHKQKAMAVCKSYSIIAKEKKSELPANLKQFKRIFSKMPFKVFGSFHLQKQVKIPLNKITASKIMITKKLMLSLYLKDRILTNNNKLRYRLRLQIHKTNKKSRSKKILIHNMVINLAAGKPMFIAGPKVSNGTLVLGLICSSK